MTKKTNSFSAAPIFLAFLCMGFGDAVGPFVGLAKETFELSNTMALLIPFIGFIMFGILSIPTGILQERKGKKYILMMGLIIALIGLIIPIFGLSSFELFLLTILLLGAGAAIQQVAGNPVMRDMSEEGKYSRNLSFAQFIKAIGSLSGPVLTIVAARWLGMDWQLLFPVFSALLLLTIVILGFTRIEEHKDNNARPADFKSCFSLLNNGFVILMVLGIFLYVGAEVCLSSGMPLYLKEQFGIDIERMGVAGTGIFFLALMIGRFSGAIVLEWMKPQIFLIITTVISIIGILSLFVGDETVAFIGIFIIGLGFANIFPLIFSITVDKMPERTNELSGLMITAIAGGAIIPLLMGVVADSSSVLVGFVVPLACLVYILITSFAVLKR